jgi:hypothetical protein
MMLAFRNMEVKRKTGSIPKLPEINKTVAKTSGAKPAKIAA